MSINEEVTEANIKQLIEGMPEGLSPLERVILCNEGTVQTLLSVIFHEPISVQVISQLEFASVIVRWTKILNGSLTVCLAESVINKECTSSEFLSEIREKKLGLGQIIKAHKLNTERLLIGFYADDLIFARNYKIIGDSDIILTEVFPREAYRKFKVQEGEVQ